MAYTIMCVEKYLVTKYPDIDWKIIARELWKVTNEYWDIWIDSYAGLVPCVFLAYKEYNEEELSMAITKDEFSQLQNLYSGITEGKEDDPDDELNYLLDTPFQLSLVYEGTNIGDGKESLDLVSRAEKILEKNNIPLPDYTKVLFSSVDELNGWGNQFDGTYLSTILNR